MPRQHAVFHWPRNVPRNRLVGVTLIELIVALAIVGLVTAVAAPALVGSVENARFRGAVRDLVVSLNRTRQAALATSTDAAFMLDVDAESYSFSPDRDSTRAWGAPSAASLTLITATSEQLATSTGVIRFFADGSSTGGVITARFDESEVRVDVSWLTGKVSVTN